MAFATMESKDLIVDLNTIREAREKAVKAMTVSVQAAVAEFVETTGIDPDAIELDIVRDGELMSGQSTVQRIEMKITL